MANFIQLDFKNAETGAAITTVFLQDDEVPSGVNRNEAGQIVANTTANGLARTWLKPDGIQFSWEIVISRNTTMNTLDQIWDLIDLGRICDVKVLSGMISANDTNANAPATSKASRPLICPLVSGLAAVRLTCLSKSLSA